MKDQTFTLQPGERSLTRIVAVLSALAKDVAWKITIARAKKDRSADQNSSLYGVAYKALSEFTGYTAPELHDCFLRAYFGEVEVDVMGRHFTKPRRTTTTDEAGNRKLLSTIEFNAFYSFIQQKGAEIGCWVPDPDPMWHQIKEEREARAA
jgi:hypothetical protein